MRKVITIVTVAGLVAAMAALGLAGASASSTTNAPAAGSRCDEGHWPATVHGVPVTFHAGAANGYYIWHGPDGWHLRTTTPVRAPHVFEGRIVSSDAIKVAHIVRGESRDDISVSDHVLSFRFVTYDGVDGVDFTIGCTDSVTFLLHENGRWVAPPRVRLGRYGHARSDPFTVERSA